MVLYEPTPTKWSICEWLRIRWMKKHWPDIQKKLEEYGYEFNESKLKEQIDMNNWFRK